MITIVLVVLGVLVLCAALEQAPLGGTTKRRVNVALLVVLGLWLLHKAGIL